MKRVLRFLGFLFATGSILFLIGVAAVGVVLWHFSQDLPDYTQLKNYEPPVMTRVHAADGTLLAEYATQRRLYIPIQAVPKMVIRCFLSAEDKDFYKHGGLDFPGIVRAAIFYVENWGTDRRPQGASTITQQVAKNFLLTNKVTFTRKIKEALLALKIEHAYSKDKILELYLNEIYLGSGAYGLAAAALTYFNKSVHQLTLAQAAYLAALPKAPSSLDPFRDPQRAIDRRNWVIDRMVENGWASAKAGEQAKSEPLGVVTERPGKKMLAAEYFVEEVRREIDKRYGEKKLYEGGLSIRTTLVPKLQLLARKALMHGLVKFDEDKGYRGPLHHIDVSHGDWGTKLADIRSFADIRPWRLAVVLEAGDKSARVGLQPGREPSGALDKTREIGIVPLAGVKWAKSAPGVKPVVRRVRKVSEVLHPGDVVYVEPMDEGANTYRLRQLPEVSGAIVVESPRTGRVLAMVGGFSFDQSQFNRATQALRQPGSSFKPFVYAAALDNGYTPSSIVMDAPLTIETADGEWSPQNYEGNFYGPSTLRFGLEHSRNVMTVRLAQDIGMPLIAEYAKRFGIYDNLPPYLSFALGAGETTLLRMVNGYSMFDNGGRKVTPTLIERIQDRYGHTIYRHDHRECPACAAKDWHDQPEPALIDRRPQVLDPLTDYQIVSLMEGVVQRGTGTVLKQLGRPVAGKTGTTNNEKDAWFIGFTPQIVCGVYIGYDKPRHLGHAMTGGRLAAPIVKDFLKAALAGKPAVPFRVPAGIKLVRVDPRTGLRVGPGYHGKSILEAFKPGTAPPDNYSMAGYSQQNGQSNSSTQDSLAAPDAGPAFSSGTGGLY